MDVYLDIKAVFLKVIICLFTQGLGFNATTAKTNPIQGHKKQLRRLRITVDFCLVTACF